jgi:hypothetical protein
MYIRRIRCRDPHQRFGLLDATLFAPRYAVALMRPHHEAGSAGAATGARLCIADERYHDELDEVDPYQSRIWGGANRQG